jgi:nicotinamidase-related amidase
MTPMNAALVIIDVQNAVLSIPGMARQAETHRAFDECVARIARLIERGRSCTIPVFFVQHDGPPGHRLEIGSWGWKIRPELTPGGDEPVIHKSASDSFFQTTLGAELEAHKTGRLIVAGCMTQYCIDTTVRQAVSLGYDVTLVADGHMTTDSATLTFIQIIAHHNELLHGLDAAGCAIRVSPVEQVLLNLQGKNAG